jgi:hypothetical protein
VLDWARNRKPTHSFTKKFSREIREMKMKKTKNLPFRFAVYFRSKINNSDFRREFFSFKLAFEFFFSFFEELRN